jgi:AcrR family transcriptional regulator
VAATATARAKRSDAVRNHGLVLAAAQAVFAEAGVDACVDDIAARAGVGRATVYRSFPTKDHLIAAVAAERLRRFEQLAVEALDRPDAAAAFRHVLVTIAVSHAQDRVVLEAMRLTGDLPELTEARAATAAALDRLMRKAKRHGAMRRDATPDDVRALLGGLTHTLTDEQQQDPRVWRRYANLIADALER